MKNSKLYLIVFVVGLVLSSCSSYKVINYPFPGPVDTQSKEISLQEKKIYSTSFGVSADNEFDGARLNGFEAVNDSVFKATVSPENFPINHSAYFSFRLWSEVERDIELEIHYTEHKHRYWPKLSRDRKSWVRIDSSAFDTLKAPNIATLKLHLTPEKLYVSGQELLTSSDVDTWSKMIATKPHVKYEVVGKSKLGRDMLFLDICQGQPKGKEAIVVIGRQHPPEVTGHFAMESFIEEIMEDNYLSNAFRKKYRILVYPLMNPDGVDLGHWRHSAGGIDLNRDWQYYHQEEIKAVTSHIVETTKRDKNDVLFGIDFHSTQKDLYYTLPSGYNPLVKGLKDLWLQGIDESLPDYTPDDRPGGLLNPISKGWFYVQLEAEAITYEIGDETPREFIRQKGGVAARELMQLLVLR